jgi:hypothetical protein
MASAGGDELSHRGAKWNIAVKNVKSGLGLIDPATPRQGEYMDDDDRDEQAYRGGDNKNTKCVRSRRRTEEPNAAPIDGQPEADYGQPRK